MRVIAGDARGRRLEALPGTDVTRPTLSQVKEAMFSIVQFDLPGARVLDLYAGSGQLGIEALSRGAARCVFLDENREAVNIVMRNCKACGVYKSSISNELFSTFLTISLNKSSGSITNPKLSNISSIKSALYSSSLKAPL